MIQYSIFFLDLSFFPRKESKCGSEICHLKAKLSLPQPLAGAEPIAVCISSLLVAFWHASMFFPGCAAWRTARARAQPAEQLGCSPLVREGSEFIPADTVRALPLTPVIY